MSDLIQNIRRFVGQSSDITCLCLSHAPSRLVTCGGEDGRVNLWTLDKANCVMTLKGYNASISTIKFHQKNDKLVGGESGGVFKVWDLNEAKLTHTFNSHKKTVNALQFHDFGPFLASGGDDQLVKLWDLRRKGTIVTYKGHNFDIKVVAFSPDGRWLASGDSDGRLQVWNMATHTKVCTFEGHRGGISSITFHPSELIMATGSTDGTAKVWDLDEMKELSSITYEGIQDSKSVLFSSGGGQLVCLSNSRLHMCGWGPATVHCHADTLHPDVKEGVLHHNVLICAEFNKNVVNTFQIDTTKLSNNEISKSSLDSTRKTFKVHRPAAEVLNEGKRNSIVEEDEGDVEVKVNDYQQFFGKDSKLHINNDEDIFLQNKEDIEKLNGLSEGHRNVIDSIKSRSRCLQMVNREWQTNSLESALETAVRLRDLAALVDILHVLLGNVNLWTMDICLILLPVLEELITSEKDEYCHISLSTLRLIGHTFGHVIKSSVQSPPPAHENDVHVHDRFYKDKTIYKILGRIHKELGCEMKHIERRGRLGDKIKEMYELLGSVFD